jgi:hypothetical protein
MRSQGGIGSGLLSGSVDGSGEEQDKEAMNFHICVFGIVADKPFGPFMQSVA